MWSNWWAYFTIFSLVKPLPQIPMVELDRIECKKHKDSWTSRLRRLLRYDFIHHQNMYGIETVHTNVYRCIIQLYTHAYTHICMQTHIPHSDMWPFFLPSDLFIPKNLYGQSTLPPNETEGLNSRVIVRPKVQVVVLDMHHPVQAWLQVDPEKFKPKPKRKSSLSKGIFRKYVSFGECII